MLDALDFILPGSPDCDGLNLAFTRYRPHPSERSSQPPVAAVPQLALVALHCVAAHKESWAPTVEHLFDLQAQVPLARRQFNIREVWAMDSPNHGRAGLMNTSLLISRPEGVSGAQWARGVQVLLRSGLISPSTAIVGMGHSAGACVMIQATEGYPLNELPLSSIILVEPTMMTREIYQEALQRDTVLLRVIDVAKTRKDVWPSRQAAREWLGKRMPWRRWDPRVLDLYVEHSLCDLPTITYPDRSDGVTLSTTRPQEASGYCGFEDGFAGLVRLQEICTVIPVHTIFASENDMVPQETQRAIVSEKDGRRMSSISKVDKCGHLIAQENPQGLATAIWNVLCRDFAGRTSKL